ncbi:contractile injection system protein, VgrG/Pvc8 family [Candidatus Thiosymbion oneisti]|uniref:contractile injection system protein, VgrG/Pvc8 family n=1 Tax=Candidatus Thiosymbion oneisti TaxID=589554 RepID=UPI0010600E7D|nr:contractile injection system protein, VgrG/Pvc8 family [Candidatus Thiosymbion oneisti]
MGPPHEHALERYDYPGGYTQYDQGDDCAPASKNSHVDYETLIQGAGNARGLATGSRFKLTGVSPPRPELEYLIVSPGINWKSGRLRFLRETKRRPGLPVLVYCL